MARNYAAGSPVGDNTQPITADTPAPFKAIAQYLSENATVSSVLTLTQNTSAIEIATGGTSAVVRWVSVTDTAASVVAVAGATANFDHMVPANWRIRLVVPIESGVNVTTGATITSMVGANREYGLYQRVAIKTQGIASVAVTEYGRSNSY